MFHIFEDSISLEDCEIYEGVNVTNGTMLQLYVCTTLKDLTLKITYPSGFLLKYTGARAVELLDEMYQQKPFTGCGEELYIALSRGDYNLAAIDLHVYGEE